ncbi:ABC transporter permease subunit [Paracoccus aminophilus]|uniref:ABC-type proline/glycine betaine transport systems, permease component n=1 Tax=Paracoccus aminophilus JCM 7686 TaxID=1367847 RepID=S5Y0P4_PARAH|nr:ABC transporter permease subunit [Paracoccus aminophilus]AGT11057.1 ABC-type proline/glycine betaine transport systems, permease component [Paracoccus aminophilus JCM 7686]
MTETSLHDNRLTEPARSQPRKLPLGLLLGLGSAGALVTLWALASRFGWVSPVFLPPPAKVWRALVTASTSGYANATLWQHMAASLGRVLSALVLTMAVAIPAGLIIATSRIGRGLLDPLIEFIRPLPPLAYLPLIIIWCGIGEPSKVLVISIAMLAPIVISTVSGVRAAGESQIRAAQSFGASRAQIIREVMLPAALPSILTGIRIALGAGWTTLVAAELVAATRGLGYMIQSAAQFLVTDMVIAGILVISALATVSELILRWIERRFLPWVGK